MPLTRMLVFCLFCIFTNLGIALLIKLESEPAGQRLLEGDMIRSTTEKSLEPSLFSQLVLEKGYR